MRRTLSAKYTFTVKYILPFLLTAVFLVMNLALWHAHKTDEILLGRCLLLLLMGPGIIFSWFYFMQFKRVQTDEQALYVSNYLHETRIPFTEILNASVEWQNWQGGQPGGGYTSPIVHIEFRPPNSSTKQIKFIATTPWNYSHSIVEELREWRDRAKNQSL